MNIAFDVSYIQKTQTGIGRLAELVIKALLAEEKGNEYVLHGWSWGLHTRLIRMLAGPRVRLSTARIPGQLKRFYWNRLRFPDIETFVGEVDIFHSNDPLLPPAKRAKTICTIHDLAYLKYPQMFERNVTSLDVFVRRSARTAGAIITPSEHSKRDIMELLGVEEKRVHVIPIPASSSFSLAENTYKDSEVLKRYGITRPYMLFVGTLEPRKNVPALVRAFEIFRETSRRDMDLVIVGKKGWLYAETLRALARSKFNENICCLGYLPESDVASLYRRAEWFVFPSLYEGFGSPVMEAMASGTPVITSNNSALRELADGVAMLVEATNPGEIAEAMLTLARDDVRRMDMRQRGLNVAQRYTASMTAKAVLELYTKILRA